MKAGVETQVESLEKRRAAKSGEQEELKEEQAAHHDEEDLPLGGLSLTGSTKATQMPDFKVGAASNIKKVAGTIAHTCRNTTGKDVCRLVAGGEAAANQSVKSIALARQYLRLEGMDLSVLPCFDPFGAIYLEIRRHDVKAAETEEEKVIEKEQEEEKKGDIDPSWGMKVAQRSNEYKLAGAIAETIRGEKEGKGLRLMAQGMGAVMTAIKGLVHSRGYLLDDHLDCCFAPSFRQIQLSTTEAPRSLICFDVSLPRDEDAPIEHKDEPLPQEEDASLAHEEEEPRAEHAEVLEPQVPIPQAGAGA